MGVRVGLIFAFAVFVVALAQGQQPAVLSKQVQKYVRVQTTGIFSSWANEARF
jgi:hypothetical protein